MSEHNTQLEQHIIKPIGYLQSCFKEKFGIPRQPQLVPAATAELVLLPPFDRQEAVVGLEQCSHVWLSFIFHQSMGSAVKPTVRPPRLGGNKRLGVFATRSPVRPNYLGLSVVKLEKIHYDNARLTLQFSGIDLLDGTPVVDIKPYVPYVDAVLDAVNGFAEEAPTTVTVHFSEQARKQCESYQCDRQEGQQHHTADIITLIQQVLQQDPRPQYHAPDAERQYGMKLLDLDVRWQYLLKDNNQQDAVWEIEVVEVIDMASSVSR